MTDLIGRPVPMLFSRSPGTWGGEREAPRSAPAGSDLAARAAALPESRRWTSPAQKRLRSPLPGMAVSRARAVREKLVAALDAGTIA